MPTPQAGVTHDIVIHVNNSVTVGLIVKDYTYRVSNAPSFIPKFAVGDPRGTDYSRWRSFVQDDFSGGMGQLSYAGVVGNNRYADSTLVELVRGHAQGAGLEQKASARTGQAPIQITAAASQADIYTSAYPVGVVMFSNRPHVFHQQQVALYTNMTGLDVWLVGAHHAESPFTGVMAAVAGSQPIPATAHLVTPVIYSSTIIVAAGQSLGLRVYGSSNPTTPVISGFYVPQYNTSADRLEVFDNKLWRFVQNRAAYLDLSVVNNSTAARWSSYLPIGSNVSGISRTKVFNGRMYCGKPDGLFVYDAGRVYQVLDYAQESDPSNFAVLEVCQGALYFNILSKLFRLTGANTVEEISLPSVGGLFKSGAVLGGVLYLSLDDEFGDAQVLRFDPTTGGATREFSVIPLLSPSVFPTGLADTSGTRAPYLTAAGGALWIAPMALTVSQTTSSVIAVIDKRHAFLETPGYFGQGPQAELITSAMDFGMRDINKLYRRIRVRCRIPSSAATAIKVYYSTPSSGPALKGPQLVEAYAQESTPADGTAKLRDGATALLPANTWDIVRPSVADVWVYFGFTQPINGMQVYAMASVLNVGTGARGPWQYNASGGWTNLSSVYDPTIDGTKSPGILTRSGRVQWTQPDDWVQSTVNGKLAYYVRVAGNTAQNPALFMARLTEIVPNQHVLSPATAWTLLGSITDPTVETTTLTFPDNLQGPEIALKFELDAAGSVRPALLSYEIEYLPVGPDRELLQVGANVLATNKLELLDLTVENSAQHITASLFSMNGAGITYTVELPYPPPVAHTRRMTVEIADPGAVVPILAYGHSFPDADIGVRLVEM